MMTVAVSAVAVYICNLVNKTTASFYIQNQNLINKKINRTKPYVKFA